jgi:23S rRNA (uracil1939-C5)-methyltransferase
VRHQSKLNPNAEPSAKVVRLSIHDMTHDGRGVAKLEGKTVFVTGALTDEVVDAQLVHQKSQYLEAKCVAIIEPSAHRIEPACAHFGSCGGCQLQHLSSDNQLAFKQNQLARSLVKAGIDTTKTEWHSPLTGVSWHYRRRARWALNRQHELCYRSAGGKYLVPIQFCPQLSEPLTACYTQLREALSQLPCQGVDEIECLAIGELSLVLHTNQHWRAHQLSAWQTWCDRVGIKGLAVQTPERGAALTLIQSANLHYQLEHLTFQFSPDQFVQTHATVNQQMVALAKTWLAASKEDAVLELFCGMGNFSLPIAQSAGSLLGLELNEQSVATAKANATINGIENAKFARVDLFAPDWRPPAGLAHVLLDPPWDGAQVVCERVAKQKSIKRVLYVSCHPATMTRDIAVLQKAGFKLNQMALIDQFPQSYHVEAMALLIRT